MKTQFIFCLLTAVLFLSGCKKEETIENTPVTQIEISTPPVIPEPKPQPPSPRDEDGVYKISDLRFYNTVTPIGAVTLSENEKESRFYVPDMPVADIKKFIEKYFPYQRYERFPRTDIIEVYPEILPQFDGDAIIPTTDPNIIKPIPETAVYIQIFWNRDNHYYEWVYQNPLERARIEEAKRNPPPEPEPEPMSEEEKEKLRLAREREMQMLDDNIPLEVNVQP